MKRAISRPWFRYLLLFLWMAVIFALSATPDLKTVPLAQRFHLLPKVLGPQATDILELILRKSAHMLAYAVLALLGRWAFVSSRPGWSRSRLAGSALALAVLYALSDEYHQTFVPGREGRLLDVGIDTVGAALGLTVGYLLRRPAPAPSAPAGTP